MAYVNETSISHSGDYQMMTGRRATNMCNNLTCQEPTIAADYRIVNGSVICVGCYEAWTEQTEWMIANPGVAETDSGNRILQQSN